MTEKIQVAAILLMAGKGERFNATLPKQFHNLSGKKIYIHTLEAFLKTDLFSEIILVCHRDSVSTLEKEIASFNVSMPSIKKSKLKIVQGGATRQESSYKGLLACNKSTDIVVLHDGVRPFVSSRIIEDNIREAIKHKAVDTCIDTFDTIVQTTNSGVIDKIPERKFLKRGQTPQSFEYNTILKAHEKALKDNIENSSDDCSLAINMGLKVYVVKGDDCNIKITNQMDLFIAEQMFRTKISEATKTNHSLKSKLYVVVGGLGGIGKEIVKLLESNDASAVPLSRNSPIKMDLTDPLSIKEAFNEIYVKYGEIDGLINSAGSLIISPLLNMSEKEIDNLIEVNYKGLILSCKEARIKKDGHIINIGSSACFKGRANASIYSSCKAGVVNFTQALAEEFPEMKINIVIPQRTDTPMRRNNFPTENKNTLLHPKNVAEAAVDLLKNNELTGSIIEVKK